jgi:hypothetical protein
LRSPAKGGGLWFIGNVLDFTYNFNVGRGAAILFALLFCALILSVSLTFVANLRAQENARALLQEVRALRIGESTEKDVLRIVQQYGGEAGNSVYGLCPTADKKHSVAIRSGGLKSYVRGMAPFRMVLLQLLGYPTWEAGADFNSDHGQVCSVQYHLYTSPTRNFVSLHLSVNYHVALPNLPSPYDVPYGVSVKHGKDSAIFWVELTNEATEEQKQHAFDFDLSCLKRYGRCQSGCEVMPSAWLDYQEKARAQGLPLPEDEKNNPNCKTLPSSQ